MQHVLYESCPWHTRCALFDTSGRLLSLRYNEPSRPFIEGAVVLGRVRQVNPSLGSAFVDIGDTHDALLPLNTLPSGHKLTQGARVLARISRGGFAEKGARLDARTALKMPPESASCPSLIQPAPSALTRILHDAGTQPVTVWLSNASQREVVALQVPERQIRNLTEDPTDWQSRLDDVLDALLHSSPTFTFSGGHLIVELTSAVATIDVNAGPMLGATKEEAVLTANLAAAEEVARLCRLLDLGGSVIVDFITPKSHAYRQLISQHLEQQLRSIDESFVELRTMSRHGLLELTRERAGPSLTLLLKTPAYVAGRIGLQLWRTPAGANPQLRKQTVTAHPSVIQALKPHLTQSTCLAHLGRPITLTANPQLPVTSYLIHD